MRNGEPAYIQAFERGVLAERAGRARELLRQCEVCPRKCRVDRLGGEDDPGVCRIGRYSVVSSFGAHHGEEDCLRGWLGSGTVFFGGCNLRCPFCQNYEISHGVEGGEVDARGLARIFLRLQEQGCHNVNFVTPTHVAPQILEALPIAVEDGLRIPLVYNTGAYDRPEILALFDGIVDIYMPDFKFWDPIEARRHSLPRGYPGVAKRAILEMHRQVGDLVLDPSGLARRGLLVRHLVMPGGVAGTRSILRFLAKEVSPDTFVNLMAQYHPAGRAHGYPGLDRRITPDEYRDAVVAAREVGLRRLPKT